MQSVLIDGVWSPSSSSGSFQATNPTTGQPIAKDFPISQWADVDQALCAAQDAFRKLAGIDPEQIALFLEKYADLIANDKETLVQLAHEESGLPTSPRLGDVELPRTVAQLKQAAAAARTGSWAVPTLDTKANIRSCYEAIGPVCVFGPNNFPFAFNSIAGGDFAAAIAAGNPVIGKANSSHPATTERLAQLAHQALSDTDLPKGFVQLIYRTSHEDGEKLVSDPRLGAVGYTGSRNAGLQLKQAADKVGKPFYAELSSVNPVVYLPGVMKEKKDKLAEEFVASGLMGAGQFCTNPGLLLVVDSPEASSFVQQIVASYEKAASGTLLSKGVETSLTKNVAFLNKSGAELLTGGTKLEGGRCAVANTVLQVTGDAFLKDPHAFQTEAFGNAVLVCLCKDVAEIIEVIRSLEGNLTGCIYSATDGSDDADYNSVAVELKQKVGRLLNDKMPTGVAVSPAMNHGGPFPATGHPGFTAVGIPASLIRFAKLTSYDAVRADRLPDLLRDSNPRGAWRLVDGNWTK